MIMSTNARVPHPNTSTNTNNRVENVINDGDNKFFAFMDRISDSNDGDMYGNHEQFMLGSPNVDFIDPSCELWNDLLQNPLLDEIFPDFSPPVQVNDGNYCNNNGNEAVILNNGGDNNNHSRVQEGQVFGNDGRYRQEIVMDCSSCQVLREINHSDGISHSTKMELHGTVGLISHAILTNYQYFQVEVGRFNKITQDKQTINLSKKSYEMVKYSIDNYLEEKRQNGYILLPDLSPFYEALCTGYNWLGTNQPAIVCQDYQGRSSSQVTGDSQMHHDGGHQARSEQQNSKYRKRKVLSDLALQRQRTKIMKLTDFSIYFDIPVDKASQKLGICNTVVKNKIRSFDVPRWPYRKVVVIKTRIAKLYEEISDGKNNLKWKEKALDEIRILEQKVKDIFSGDMNVILSLFDK